MSKSTIGIDGDVNKSGVCVWKKSTKTIELLTLTFFELFDYFRENKNNIELVKIESGWLNKKSNFHGSKNNQTAARIGSHVGANHETGKKIVEMCQYLDYKQGAKALPISYAVGVQFTKQGMNIVTLMVERGGKRVAEYSMRDPLPEKKKNSL